MGDRAIGLDSLTRRSDPNDGEQPPPLPPDPEAAERAKRAASYELSDAYFANGGVGGGASTGADGGLFGRNGLFGPNCHDPGKYESYDYERCEPREHIENAVLFAQEAGEIDEIDPRDVRQGPMGDCYLTATLVALANTPEGRALLHGAVKENRDRADQVTYEVRLFKPTLMGLTPVTVTVDGNFVKQHAYSRSSDHQQEIWPLVIEQAYAQLNGGENRIARGGTAVDAMVVLTGKPAVSILVSPVRWPGVAPSCGGDPTPTEPYRLEDLKRDLAARKPVVLETVDSLRGGDTAADGTVVVYPEERQLVKHHAYGVLGIVEDSDGRALLKLKNPWDRGEPALVPFEELSRWFKAVDVGEMP